MTLLDSIKALCDRLSPFGWGEFLSHLTGGVLEIRRATTAGSGANSLEAFEPRR
jgi:hypothetical protein